MNQECVMVISTYPKVDLAKQAALDFVNKKLVACVHIVEGVTSVYPWEGQVMSEPEVQLQMKTTRARLPELQQVLCAHHPYDVPECIVLPIVGGHLGYLSWVEEAVSSVSRTT